MPKIVEFARETQREVAKITWPTKRETVLTTTIIVLMALAAGVFFLAVDSVWSYTIGHLLGMRG